MPDDWYLKEGTAMMMEIKYFKVWLGSENFF